MEEQGLNIEDAKRKILDFLEEKLKEARENGDKALMRIIREERQNIITTKLDAKELLKKYEATGVLKKMRKSSVDRRWNWDGIYKYDFYDTESKKPYEYTFRSILKKMGVDSFENLVKSLAEQNEGKPIRVLDLFGGAYFLTDLTDVSEIIGVRLEDVDEKILKENGEELTYETNDPLERQMKSIINERKISLIKDPKRRVILGNLYDSKTLKILDAEKKEGFRLIVCRPQSPFLDNLWIYDPHKNIARILSALLQRSMKLLAPNGIAFIQFPCIQTNRKELNDFWKNFVDKNKDFEFTFDSNDHTLASSCAIKRLR